MLKRYALKNPLRVHTVLFLVSVIAAVYGCAGLKKGGNGEDFYPEYYAAKRLDNADVVKLRGFMASSDEKVSTQAALILGINYLRYGDKNFGRMLIEKSYASAELDQQMKIFGKLWKMESLLSENDKGGAEKMRGEILSLEKDDLYIRTLKIYCVNTNRPLLDGEDPSVCVDEKFKTPASGAAGDITEMDTGGMSYEEYLKAMGIEESWKPKGENNINGSAVINVVGGDVMSEMVQGMIFAVNDLKASFAINSVSEDAANDSSEGSATVYLNRAEISVGGKAASFSVDWNWLSSAAAGLKRYRNTPNAVICAPNNKIRYAKYIAEQYGDPKANVKVLNYDNPAFQSQLRSFLKSAKKGETIMIGIGGEDEIINFIPVAKFLKSNVNQTIMLVVSSFSDASLKGEYAQYFKDVYVFTPIQLVKNKKFNDKNLGYEAFFGKPMNLMNVLGYDTVVYLSSLVEPAAGDSFLSGILGFSDGVAYRNTGLYMIGKKLDVTAVEYESVGKTE